MNRIFATAIASSFLAIGCNPNAAPSAEKPAESAPTASVTATAAAPATVEAPKGPAPIPAPADVAAAPENAEKTASGLTSVVLTPGQGGDSPTDGDRVSVHYTGWTKDGKMFDSSVQRDRPETFALNQVIKGWTEGLKLMTKGEKRRFWIPGALAYGETPPRPGMPSGQLTFDVELLEIHQAPKAPEDVAAAPKTAKKTKSGLVYTVLQEGTGASPAATAQVTVNYSGWTTDGKLFDSTALRGRPATFALNQVIAGWTEGVQLMNTGAKYRFWIPEDLAYKGRRGAPAGTLVFDIELVSFK